MRHKILKILLTLVAPKEENQFIDQQEFYVNWDLIFARLKMSSISKYSSPVVILKTRKCFGRFL